MRGLIGKFVRGAAQAGVPMLMAEHQSRVQEKRDAILQSYQQQNMATQQKFGGDQNAEDRNLTRTENQANRDQRAGENAQQVALQAGQLALETRKVESMLEAAEQALGSGEFGLVESQYLAGLMKIVTDENSTEEAKTDAIKRIGEYRNPQTGQNFSEITGYGEPDIDGNQRRFSGVLNRNDGTITPFNPSSSRGSGSVIDWSEL